MTDKIDEPKCKRKRLGWNAGSEVAILDLWEERVEELRGVRRNAHIYAEMSEDLSKLGYFHSPRDVQVKLQNFTQRYRKEKVAMGPSDGSPSTWVHYERVHQIIGGFKTNVFNQLMKESIDESPIASTSTSLPSPKTPLPSSPSPSQISSTSPVPSTSAAALNATKEKRKNSFQEKLLEKFNNLSSSIADYLNKSDENEKELIEIERRKADCLEKLLSAINKN